MLQEDDSTTTSVGSSGTIHYSLTLHKKSCSVELSKSTSSYGLWGQVISIQDDGKTYYQNTGWCSRGIVTTFQPQKKYYKSARLKVCYNSSGVIIDENVKP